MGASPLICLAFNFALCTVITPNSTTVSERGCSPSQWNRAISVISSAVDENYSPTPLFCNNAICYNWPNLLLRFRALQNGEFLLPSFPDLKCATLELKKGSSLLSLGSPHLKKKKQRRKKQQQLLPTLGFHQLPHATRPQADENELRLCVPLDLLPPLPLPPISPLLLPYAVAEESLEDEMKSEMQKEQEKGREQQLAADADVMSRAEQMMTMKWAEVMLNTGINQVNQQQYNAAITTFNQIMAKNGTGAGPLLGRGTALALSGRLQEAVDDYSQVIALQPEWPEGWKRRAQARAALNQNKEAVADMTRAMELSPGQMDTIFERGMLQMRIRDYRGAVSDFRAFVSLHPNNAIALDNLGHGLAQLGELLEGLEVLKKAVRVDPTNKIAWMHLGQAYRELADDKKAVESYQKALKIDPRFAHVWRLMALLKHGMGDHSEALRLVDISLRHEPQSVEGHYMRGSCLQALGEYQEATAEYDQCLQLSATPEEQMLQFMSFTQREVAIYTARMLNRPLVDFDIDDDFSPLFKLVWAKRFTPMLLFPGYMQQPMGAGYQNRLPKERVSRDVEEARAQLVAAADEIGGRSQYKTTGFLSNRRQHRMAGMAAIDVGQTARASWKAMEAWGVDEDDEDLDLPAFDFNGWRDVYSLIVKWRQISEPCDPVVWIDKLTREEFESGFGSVTAMVQGHTKNVRYYYNFDRAWALFKREILETGQVLLATETYKELTDDELDEVEEASSLDQLYRVLNESFMVVTPCYSTAVPDKILNGTRLTLVKNEETGGFDFAIRTPVVPSRWDDFDIELTAAWKDLCRAVFNRKLKLTNVEKYRNEIRYQILRMTFYWYNFMPLARGTAMAGYAGLAGLLLGADMELEMTIPPKTQLDWEAILSSTVDEFVERVSKWMYPTIKVNSPKKNLPNVRETFPTLASVVKMLGTYSK